jgi:hypothetical protein
MKKKQKIILGSILAIVLISLAVAGGYLYFQRQKKIADTKTTTTPQNATDKGASTEKTDNTPQQITPIQVTPSTTTTPVPATLGVLGDVSLTAYLYNTQMVAPDGKTTMEAGSITPTFYTRSGTFTIQKMVDGAWKDIITNYVYPGHGGIAAWYSGPSEDNISYRVLSIEGGKPVSASKNFVIKRADLTKGYASYN